MKDIKHPDLCWKCQEVPMIGKKEVFLKEGKKFVDNNLCQECYNEEEKIKGYNLPNYETINKLHNSIVNFKPLIITTDS